MGSKATVCVYVSVVLGLVFVVLGACLKWAIFPALVTSMINSNLKLTPDNAKAWEAWITPPVTPYMKFTFFNVLNPDEVRDGFKPRVEELGPFSYIEHREKKNPVSIYEELSYGSYIAYEFDETTSCNTCKIDTNVTVINPVMVLVPYLVDKTLNDISKSPLGSLRLTRNQSVHDLAVKLFGRVTESLNGKTASLTADFHDDIVLTGTPDNMIFNGVYSPILAATYDYLVQPSGFLFDICLELADIIADVCVNMRDPKQPIFNGIYNGLPNVTKDIIDQIPDTLTPDFIGAILLGLIAPQVDIPALLDNLDLPPMIDLQNGTFGFFKGTNATQTYWKINSGKYNLDKYQKVLEFNGNSRLPEGWWPNFGHSPNADDSGMKGVCHDIVGTDGLAFSPGITEDDTLWLFNDQLCRSIWLKYDEKVNIDGIKALKFTPPASVFSFSNPDNYCYCPDIRECALEVDSETWDLKDCHRCVDGIISLEGCQGVPVIMSTPHFLDGDERLWQSIDGLQPERDLHVTYLNVEPLSGMPLQAHKKIQISLPVSQSDYFDCMNNLLTQMNYTEKELVFPLAWVDEGADIDAENLKEAKGLLVTPFIAVDAVTGILIAIGGLMMIGSVL